MAATPAARTRDRRVWILVAAAAAAVAVAVFALHTSSRGGAGAEDQIGEQVYAGKDCVTKVSPSPRVARHWPQASKAEVIVCETSENDPFANYVMDYAQFASATTLSAALKNAAPAGSYCTIARAVVTLDESLDTFARMCANLGGTIHEAPPRTSG